MPSTYEPIATQTLGSAAATVTFSSISGTYTDLVLVATAASASGEPTISFQLNGDTGSNYSRTLLIGNGSSATSERASSSTQGRISNSTGLTTTLGANATIAQFMNYSNSTTNKTVIARSNTTLYATEAIVNLWRNTAAITSIALFTNSGVNFAAGSIFTLYGIKAA